MTIGGSKVRISNEGDFQWRIKEGSNGVDGSTADESSTELAEDSRLPDGWNNDADTVENGGAMGKIYFYECDRWADLGLVPPVRIGDESFVSVSTLLGDEGDDDRWDSNADEADDDWHFGQDEANEAYHPRACPAKALNLDRDELCESDEENSRRCRRWTTRCVREVEGAESSPGLCIEGESDDIPDIPMSGESDCDEESPVSDGRRRGGIVEAMRDVTGWLIRCLIPSCGSGRGRTAGKNAGSRGKIKMIKFSDPRRGGGGKDTPAEGGGDAKPVAKAVVRSNKFKGKRTGKDKSAAKGSGEKNDGDGDEPTMSDAVDDDVMPEIEADEEIPMESTVEAQGVGDDDEIFSAKEDDDAPQADLDDEMTLTGAPRMDRLDAEPEAVNSRGEESDGNVGSDKENGGDGANRQTCGDDVTSEPEDGGAWSGLCTCQGRRVTQKELLTSVAVGKWGASDFARSDGQAVSNEMLGSTIVSTQKLLEEAGVDWRKMTEEDQGERIAYSPLKLAIGRRGGAPTGQGGQGGLKAQQRQQTEAAAGRESEAEIQRLRDTILRMAKHIPEKEKAPYLQDLKDAAKPRTKGGGGGGAQGPGLVVLAPQASMQTVAAPITPIVTEAMPAGSQVVIAAPQGKRVEPRFF